MKRLLLLCMATAILFGAAQNASATPYQVNVGDYIFLTGYNSQVMAGEMVFDIKDENQQTYSSWATFCLEMDATTYTNTNYKVTGLTDGIENVDTDNWNQIAWLYYNFSQGTLAGYDGSQTQQSALQYAFWILNGDASSSSYAQTASYLGASAEAVYQGWQNDGKVLLAINGGQDVLVSMNPVPEPATMLLFGTGLIALAGAGIRRRKFNPKGSY